MTIYDAWQVILSNQKPGTLSKHMQAMVSAELRRLTAERKRLEPMLEAIKESEVENQRVLQILIDQEKQRNSVKLQAAEDALAEAIDPPVPNQQIEAPPLPKEPVSLDVTLDEEDETAEMTGADDPQRTVGVSQRR